MPLHDGLKYYTVTYGNYKPVIHYDCTFDNVAFRVEKMNAVLKVGYGRDGHIEVWISDGAPSRSDD